MLPICLFLFLLQFFQILFNLSFVIPNWFLVGSLFFTVISPFVLFFVLKIEGQIVLKFYNSRLQKIKNYSVEKVYKLGIPAKIDSTVDELIEKYL